MRPHTLIMDAVGTLYGESMARAEVLTNILNGLLNLIGDVRFVQRRHIRMGHGVAGELVSLAGKPPEIVPVEVSRIPLAARWRSTLPHLRHESIDNTAEFVEVSLTNEAAEPLGAEVGGPQVVEQ